MPSCAARPTGYPVTIHWDTGSVTVIQAAPMGYTGTVPCHPLPAEVGGPLMALIPISPLATWSTYTATVTGQDDNGAFHYEWSFATGEMPPLPGRIYGWVQDNGAPASQVQLEIRDLKGRLMGLVTTGEDRGYAFSSAKLEPGQRYQVVYANAEQRVDRLGVWFTEPFDYALDTDLHGGTFNIAGIALGEPDHDQAVPYPREFRFTNGRAATASQETYNFVLLDASGAEVFTFPMLGSQVGAGLFQLNQRPADLAPGVYQWTIQVQGAGLQGVGYAREPHLVRL